MLESIKMIGSLWNKIIAVFAEHPVTVGSYNVSVFGLIFAFLVFGFTISIFWKGARS